MPRRIAFVWKRRVLYAGLGILIILSILSAKYLIPDTEYGAKVRILMFLPAGMVDTVRLRRHHYVTKNTEIGFDIAMVKARIPDSKHIPTAKGRQSGIYTQTQERNKSHPGLDKPFHGVNPQISEQVHVSLRVMDGMKVPE